MDNYKEILIEKIFSFSNKFFNLEEDISKSRSRKINYVLARHITWYILHYTHEFSTTEIAVLFNRTRRDVFYGISKIRDGIKYQRFYIDIYNDFIAEYNKHLTT